MTDPTPCLSARQHNALELFLETVDDAMMASGVGPHLRCSEADALIDLLRSYGLHEAAYFWLAGHADGDDDEGDVHVQEPHTEKGRIPRMCWG
ncbi:hypothetical protein M3C97_011165 [Micrococcus luteus]|nr:hypothetical protein [Micrococcus luteus]MCV7717528.1 hypothetical protein [Micrococcus luteus]